MQAELQTAYGPSAGSVHRGLVDSPAFEPYVLAGQADRCLHTKAFMGYWSADKAKESKCAELFRERGDFLRTGAGHSLLSPCLYVSRSSAAKPVPVTKAEKKLSKLALSAVEFCSGKFLLA